MTLARFKEWNDRRSEMLPVVYLARHGETAWNLSGQHTARTDRPAPKTERGERDARALGERCTGWLLPKCSPAR